MASGYLFISDRNTEKITDSIDQVFYKVKFPVNEISKTLKIDLFEPVVGISGSEVTLSNVRIIGDVNITMDTSDSPPCASGIARFYMNGTLVDVAVNIVYAHPDTNEKGIYIHFNVIEGE